MSGSSPGRGRQLAIWLAARLWRRASRPSERRAVTQPSLPEPTPLPSGAADPFPDGVSPPAPSPAPRSRPARTDAARAVRPSAWISLGLDRLPQGNGSDVLRNGPEWLRNVGGGHEASPWIDQVQHTWWRARFKFSWPERCNYTSRSTATTRPPGRPSPSPVGPGANRPGSARWAAPTPASRRLTARRADRLHHAPVGRRRQIADVVCRRPGTIQPDRPPPRRRSRGRSSATAFRQPGVGPGRRTSDDVMSIDR
jgi:hypothetical protein